MPAPDDRLDEAQLRVRRVRRQALAKALVTARHKAGLTQGQLAERSGLSRSAIARAEAGEASLSSDRFWDLAKALGIRPSALWLAAEADEAASRTLD
ncbi:helix-turn-helix domain protein [Gordonia bronchialis DSM 43247]|uniref:Helix-turn-helix domain protein n=1 Tax=Gordonia bronchialis (strain ATCC 25592 / DSM 43247 / BCRC 13721 / JCM 3198 / KCTC 3076 / NBRC 16047 / NCTC 10667) TaxID=526226 RepID=D0LEF5_GORB4|nr:helix-turn-helix transcriptional regulator [Gordonia bronchialis]ACY19873.1 helix-turn-helix domain protein [Gordonia bronchialis DSM 43247]MCC3322645.1 helix-turn-helix domain-containing protein [Gordonia bronchialis]QGS26259.1 helix-turn-helix domain-containing protein [Gordonia bronchialis]STQ62650.1 anaerobic benzoate catabolism transcriptional regulator [Gordonia bronchialis]